MGTLLAALVLAQLPVIPDYFDPPAPNAPIVLRANMPAGPRFVSPAHATLLPDGRVLFIGVSHETVTGTGGNLDFVGILEPDPPYAPAPAEKWVAVETPPLEFDGDWLPDEGTGTPRYYVGDVLFCAGQTLTADGRFFTAGGTRLMIDGWDDPNVIELRHFLLGTDYSTLFDGAGWRRVAARMQERGTLDFAARWYPLATRLADGKILVTSGSDLVQARNDAGVLEGYLWQNRSVELFDPANESWSRLSTHTDAPREIWNPDYTHAFQLPSPVAAGFELLFFGDMGVPVLLSRTQPEGAQWLVRSDRPRPETLPGEFPNFSATSTLLPLRLSSGEWGYANGSVLVTGGDHGTTHEHAIDVYDPVANAWHARRDMVVHRHLPMTLNLPDGRTLVVAGAACGCSSTEVKKATYVFPQFGFAIGEGSAEMPETRGYHAVSLLLPDGRVLIAGGRTHGHEEPTNEQPTMRYLYPSYMFDELRSSIWQAPDVVRYGEAFGILWGGRALHEAVLVGLGSMTHAFDANQRHVQIPVAYQEEVQPNEHAGWLVGPPDARTAPPGHYMLFLVDAQGIPGFAKIVKLE